MAWCFVMLRLLTTRCAGPTCKRSKKKEDGNTLDYYHGKGEHYYIRGSPSWRNSQLSLYGQVNNISQPA